MVKTATIPVTVAKAHPISLGERMYVDAIELLRELVANAYDADATVVCVRHSMRNQFYSAMRWSRRSSTEEIVT